MRPEGQHQRVPMAFALTVDRLDGRALMDHPVVVEQQGGPGIGHREPQAGGAVGLEHTGLAALDADTVDQYHDHEVDAVAVRAFGGGSAARA